MYEAKSLKLICLLVLTGPIPHVQPNDLNHAIGCPGAPLMSLREKCKSAQLRPISTFTIGRGPNL